MQDLLRVMSEKDKKINSLVEKGYAKDEANMAITICGMPLFLKILITDHAYNEKKTLCCIFC